MVTLFLYFYVKDSSFKITNQKVNTMFATNVCITYVEDIG